MDAACYTAIANNDAPRTSPLTDDIQDNTSFTDGSSRISNNDKISA